MSKQDGRFSTVIRVGLRERFFNEAAGGVLVNRLLSEHYGMAPRPQEPAEPAEDGGFDGFPGEVDALSMLAERQKQDQEVGLDGFAV